MPTNNSDCELTGVLNQLSQFFSWQKHSDDLRTNSRYRRIVEQLQEKGYIVLKEDHLFIITERGYKLLEECK